MWRYVLRRLIAVPPLLLAVSFITYALLYAAPGDFVTQLENDPSITPETLADLRAQFGLDGGLLTRYWHWLINALQLDFGRSFSFQMDVSRLIGDRLANTLILTLTAMIFAWCAALPLGTLAAAFKGRWIDKIVGFIAFFGLSIPRVFFALLMVMFAASTHWFPTGGMRDLVEWEDMSAWQQVVDVAWHTVLPAFVVGSTQMAAYTRQMRAEMIEALGADYARTARAKGLAPWQVVFKHAFGNAINPLITLFGYSLAALLTGSFLVEVVFAWPGLARLTIKAVMVQDEPVVMAAVMMATLMLVAGNLIADLLLALIDPRIGLDS